MSTKILAFTFLAAALAATACSNGKPNTPIVTGQDTQVLDGSKPCIGGDSCVSIRVTLTVDRNSLLNQEFLYGADLQYSSFFDPSMNLYNQSLALGHIPAVFRISGNELQLIADNRRLYPGDANHPEQLLSRFQITSQTDTQLVISGADSHVFLAEVFEGTHTDTQGGLSNPAGAPPRDSWIRSFDYVPNGNYLLQQSSVILADGSIAEFMESIFPRAALTP